MSEAPFVPDIMPAEPHQNGDEPLIDFRELRQPHSLAIHADASVVSLDAHRRAQVLSGAPCTDLGNGERFASRHGERARYLTADQAWYVWNEIKWERDQTLQIRRYAKDTIRAVKDEALNLSNADERLRIIKHVHASEMTGRLQAMLTCASAEPGIAITPDAFDTNPMLLTCQNGTLDIATRQLDPNVSSNLITRATRTVYDPQATCPLWLKFLHEIFDGNQELIGYMQRAIGYSLTGDMREDAVHILWGTGANGKSTWNNALAEILGDYAESADITAFLTDAMPRSAGAPRDDLARLRGARFVRASEPDERRSLSASVLKELTGREPITARFLFGSTFKFKPVFKLWLSTNHKPPIHDASHGMWRRIRLIPFTVQIPLAQRDGTLHDRLLTEAPGILNWAVQGAQDWLQYGLQPPATVSAATEQYQTDSDLLGLFVRDMCKVETWRSVDAGQLYKVYKEWCDRTGERAWANQSFHRRLTDRGFPVDHMTGKRMGISVREDYQPARFM